MAGFSASTYVLLKGYIDRSIGTTNSYKIFKTTESWIVNSTMTTHTSNASLESGYTVLAPLNYTIDSGELESVYLTEFTNNKITISAKAATSRSITTSCYWLGMKSTPLQVTITVKSSDETKGTVSGGGTVNKGTNVTITATPATGCRFVQWNDGNTNATRTVKATSNKTYTATFVSTYTVSITVGNHGSCSPSGSITVDEGSTATLVATPDTGYGVDKWYVNGSLYLTGETTCSIPGITENKTVSVSFRVVTTNSSEGEWHDPKDDFIEEEYFKEGYVEEDI